MSHPYYHAVSSARKFGGVPGDYEKLHDWFDQSKMCMPDVRHRALRHHAEGVFVAEQIFGITIRNSDGQEVPVRTIGEQHVIEDLGWIPTVQDWLSCLAVKPWMLRTGGHRSTQHRSSTPQGDGGPAPAPNAD